MFLTLLIITHYTIKSSIYTQKIYINSVVKLGIFMLEKDNTTQFGLHYMLDGYGASPELLKNKKILIDILQTVPEEMGMHSICEPVVVEVGPNNMKDPGGLSGFVMIAESHISFHTFPSRGFVTIDVYTCQNEIDTYKLTKKFTEAFNLTAVDEFIKPRGIKYPLNDLYQ